MKKIILLTGIGLFPVGAAALSTLPETTTCYINNCLAVLTADSSCNYICDWCSGSVTTPTGYVYKDAFADANYVNYFSRQVSTLCGDTTYSCHCGVNWTSLAMNGSLLCDTGYYGFAAYSYTERGGDSFSGCTPCPSSGGIQGTTARPGATFITECYIPAGEISWTDDTGTYVCGENSYYEE